MIEVHGDGLDVGLVGFLGSARMETLASMGSSALHMIVPKVGRGLQIYCTVLKLLSYKVRYTARFYLVE